ncbi:MAG TPA: alpha-hydroxy acid oxidase [Gaiellaceae bacterium]|nr:alpha-hydroxy acid oxidase [Gaiellaceae bacterium]
MNATHVESIARSSLPPEVYDFYAGGSWGERTLEANTAAWDDVLVAPRVLRDVSAVSLEIELLGERLPHPILVAPVAYQGLLHADAEVATARGAAAASALHVVSSRSTRPLEEIAAVPGRRWFQVYVLRDRGLTGDIVKRAAAAGYSALVLTGDAPILGPKTRDLRNGFVVPEELARGNLAVPRRSEPALQDPATTWADVGWLRDLTGLPVLVKGILRADDAREAVAAGAAGVVVSNHGGRQLDGAVSTAWALPRVADAVGGELPVLVDGGIRSGVDVLRAVVLGARAVLLGRPVAWALAAGGAAAVEALLRATVTDTADAFALAGCRSTADCTRDLIAG